MRVIQSLKLHGLVLWLAIIHTLATISPAQTQGRVPSQPWIKTKVALTILSANDGQAHLKFDGTSVATNSTPRFATNLTRDSITVIHLGPDHPPIIKTVYDTVPNTVFGPPYLALSRDGRYGFVTCHNDGVMRPRLGDLLTVIDLSSPDLGAVQKLKIPSPTMAIAHPDGSHVIVGCDKGFQVFELHDSQFILQKENRVDGVPDSFDLSPSGDRIVAALSKGDKAGDAGVHVFSYQNGAIVHQHEVKVRNGLAPFNQPFSLRFSPDGKRVLVPNGGGGSSKGTLDDLLSIDMTLDPPEVTEVVPQIADGIEGLAFHPSGQFAVLGCLEDVPGYAAAGFSHLAVVDLTSKPARLLYELGVEPIPEGISFTPDGSQLFVQLTSANRIAVFDVDGFMLNRSPFVIRVGHAPSSMGLEHRFSGGSK